ncbi:MAG TPA: zf-TFIIB domain-containing protein [Gaiellaceae bacterium]|nr:zf-TFIIB domain-containing protein [Gaiellaceae bacterium]
MTCFACNVPLQQTLREGVEIDYCPQCRSIWLDRGELEKLVDRLGSWYPETLDGYERRWPEEDDYRIGPRSRIDDLFDVR